MHIHENLKIIESNVKMPLMQLPTKMFLVKVGQSVIAISPSPKFSNDIESIVKYGVLTDIVAPNLFHNIGIPRATETFPEAKLWGAPGFEKKRPKFKWTIISSENWPYSEELEPLFIEGLPKINEVVFLHKPSKSLIVTDLFFNHVHGRGFGYWLIFNMFGTYKKFAVSKFYLKMVTDKGAFKNSIEKLMKMDFENILVPHGENILGKAKNMAQQAFKERGYEV